MSINFAEFPHANIRRMLENGKSAIHDGLTKNTRGKINLVFTTDQARSSSLTVPEYQQAAAEVVDKFYTAWKGKLHFEIFVQPEEETGLTLPDDHVLGPEPAAEGPISGAPTPEVPPRQKG